MPGRGHGRSVGPDPYKTATPLGYGGHFRDDDRRANRQSTSGQGRGRGVQVENRTSGGRGRGRGNGSVGPGNVSVSHPSFRSNADLPQLSLVYELPENSDVLARDFDETSDLIHAGRIRINDYLSKKFGFDVADPENWPEFPKGANLFHDGCVPKFPSWPEKGGNPFELLPLKKRGYFPFDDYGKLMFFQSELDKWYHTSDADEELFEIQFRELTHILQLNGRWVVDLQPSEGESYGTVSIFSNYPAEKQLERVGARDLTELDSGFVTESFDNITDPCVFDPEFLEKLDPNEFSWEPYEGTGFVRIQSSMTLYEKSTFVRSKVSDWSIEKISFYNILFIGKIPPRDRHRSPHQYEVLVGSKWQRTCSTKTWRSIRFILHCKWN